MSRRSGLRGAAFVAVMVVSSVGIATPTFGAAKAWKVVPSPSVAAAATLLTAVTCVDASTCVAVGTYEPAVGASYTLVEVWDGAAWSIEPSSDPGSSNQLSGVSCLSSTDCFAVGSFRSFDGAPEQTLTERWDGLSWTVVPSPNPSSEADRLTGVACSSHTSCMAVGSGGGEGAPLTEAWDGSQWSVVANPITSQGNYLLGLSCPAADDCVAVGQRFVGTRRQVTLIEKWDGSSWSVVKSPNDRGHRGEGSYNSLSGVSCVTVSNCTAVGSFYDGVVFTTLIETWDGIAWSIKRSPNAPSTENGLTSVSCATTTDCAAVGFYENTSVSDRNLVEVWHGGTWARASSANPGNYENIPTSVTCPTTTRCFAVGYYGDSGSLAKTMVLSP